MKHDPPPVAILATRAEGVMAEDLKLAAADALMRAAEVVETGWTQCELARDASGMECKPSDSTAVCWCAEGALRRVFRGSADQDAYSVAFSRLHDAAAAKLRAAGRWHVAALAVWNDDEDRTADQVATMMRECAVALRSEVSSG